MLLEDADVERVLPVDKDGSPIERQRDLLFVASQGHIMVWPMARSTTLAHFLQDHRLFSSGLIEAVERDLRRTLLHGIFKQFGGAVILVVAVRKQILIRVFIGMPGKTTAAIWTATGGARCPNWYDIEILEIVEGHMFVRE